MTVDPNRLIVEGLQVMVEPAGAPAAENETVPVKAPSGITVRVKLADPPCPTGCAVGVAVTEKSAGAFTVKATGAAVRVISPVVADTKMLDVEGGAFGAATDACDGCLTEAVKTGAEASIGRA